jgi:hypothetical protein
MASGAMAVWIRKMAASRLAANAPETLLRIIA